MQLLQLFTQWLEMLCIGFSQNAFNRILGPFESLSLAMSTSGESNLSSSSAKCQPTPCQEAPPLLIWVLSIDWDGLGGFPAWLLSKAAYGVDEAWYFTNAIAASSLQNSSSTITPSSNVMWSMLRKRKKNQQRIRTGTHRNQPWGLKNMQCIYSHGPFRLQAQQAFSDQQKFGSEIWDALDPNHEVPNDL